MIAKNVCMYYVHTNRKSGSTCFCVQFLFTFVLNTIFFILHFEIILMADVCNYVICLLIQSYIITILDKEHEH
jgi:hypothetical protein